MKVSYNWLKELIDLNGIERDKFVHDLSLYSIEVDGVENLQKATGLVVGRVLSKEKHPDADKLNVCQVDIGTEVRQIVCGAPNCAAGKNVIVAQMKETDMDGFVNEMNMDMAPVVFSLMQHDIQIEFIRNYVDKLDTKMVVMLGDSLDYMKKSEKKIHKILKALHIGKKHYNLPK